MVFSHGGDQAADYDCDTAVEDSSLVLNEETTNTVRYTYRVTWQVRYFGALPFSVNVTS